MRARVQRSDIREQPVSIPGVSSLIMYDDYDQAIFAFYTDFGGVLHYASSADSDFEKIYSMASGGQPPQQVAKISNLNIKKS